MTIKTIMFSTAAVAALGLVGWLALRSGAETPVSAADTAAQSQNQPQSRTAPATVTAAPANVPSPAAPPAVVDLGVSPAFHPQVASIAEAHRTGKHPERLSLDIAPAPFDLKRYEANPQQYLNIVEPGRVYQTAAAGPNAVPLIATIDRVISIPALGSTALSVRGKPNAPVSWTILGGGVFTHNRLTSTTVLTSAEGIATVTYEATPGVYDAVSILVGSPLMVGTLTLMLQVAEPAATVSQR
jgi:hypothetical protein